MSNITPFRDDAILREAADEQLKLENTQLKKEVEKLKSTKWDKMTPHIAYAGMSASAMLLSGIGASFGSFPVPQAIGIATVE